MKLPSRSLFLAAVPAFLAVPAHAVPAGFKIVEFASPPQVSWPTALSAAANGDVYISSDQNGSLGHSEHMGKIIRARDTNGDGKADQFLDFVPDVNSPRGGHMVGGTFYLIHPPYLSSYTDLNGDGKADKPEETKLLLDGLGGGIEHPRGADHTTNSVRMGIDGWLYIAVGDFGMKNSKGTDGKRYILQGGGVARIRPDGSELEPYALMVRNIVDIAISPELDLFSRDNTNDGKGWNTRFHHFTELGDHGYPRLYKNFADEAIVPLKDFGGGSGTGALWLQEPGFPAPYNNTLFSCDWTTGNIYHNPVTREFASFSVGQETFEKLPHAIDIDVDGFSRLYLADWRNGGFSHDKKPTPVGMIHQVTFPGETPAKYVEVTKAPDDQLVSLVTSRSTVQRMEAQREIIKRNKPVFAQPLLAACKDSKLPVSARVAAIFTMKQAYGKNANKPLAELVSDDAIREFVLRAMADRLGELDNVPVKPYVDALKDPNPRVVLQALIGLQRLKAKDAAPAILAASAGWKDGGVSPRLAHTASEALIRLGNSDALLSAAKNPATRGIALRSLERMHNPEVIQGLISLVSTPNDAGASDPGLRYDGLLALARLNFKEKEWDLKSWWNTKPDDRGPYFDPVAWEASASIKAAIEKNFPSLPEERKGAFLTALAQNRIPVAEYKLSGLDPAMAALGSAQLDKAKIALLAAAAKDSARPASQRVECYRALFRADEKEAMNARLDVLAAWSADSKAPADAPQHIDDFVNETQRGLEIDALRKIAKEQGDAVSRIAWKALLTVMNSPLAKDPWKQSVKKMVDANPREVGFFLALGDLKLAGFEKQIEAAIATNNHELVAAAEAVKKAASSNASTGKRVAELPLPEVAAAAMKGKGDIATGKRLFTAQGCIACHSTDLSAEQKGPYLGAAGAKFTRDYLIDSVLEPNKVVAQGFQTSSFTLKDGSTILGFVTGEADGVVELRDITGKVTKLKRDNVSKEEHLTNSMMPTGLALGLTVQDFTSLVEYLGSLKANGG